MNETQAARDFFPRGLIQPEGSFRFSLDALLLASFAAKTARAHGAGAAPLLLDLGCGCGVVAFGVMLRLAECRGIGLDKQPELVAAAARNAARLGFGGRYQALELDLEAPSALANLSGLLAARQADVVMANPPYRLLGRGRLPAAASRRQALFGDAGNLVAFVRAAAFAAGDSGAICMIFPFARTNELAALLLEAGFPVAEQLLVYNRKNEAPFFSLLRAQKKTSPARAAAPAGLILYQNCVVGRSSPQGLGGHRAGLTEEALQFCPFLACNQKRE